MEPTGPSDPLNEMLRQFDRISEKSHNMANVRDICALMEYPIPYQYPSVSRKLRCVYTGRDIKCNIKFDGLTLERLIIYENQLWAIDDRKHIVAFNVTSGEKVHEIMFPRGIGVGLTIFKDRMFAYSTYELYEIKHIPGTTTRALVLEAIFPHEIFALLIQRRDEQQISFVVETQRGKIIEAVVANQNVARCRLLKSDNHFLSGVYGSHVFVYCLDSNDIIDTRNNIIERSFPPEHDEMLCRFRMSQDGILYYCCWDEIDEPWTIVSLNAVTGNRRFYPTDSNHIYMIPCARFVPVYEDE